ITAGLLLWHGLAVYAINDPSLLVSPIVVARTAYEMLFVTGELYPHLWASSWILNGPRSGRGISFARFLSSNTGIATLSLPALLALTGVAHAADGGMLKMRFTQSGNTSSSWPLYVAEQKKMFEKNGIQVEVIIIRGATNVVRAVLSETIPIGRINPDYVIGAADKGAKVKIVAANMEKIPYDIYARPEIKAGADLKGKTLGVSTLTGGTTLMLHEVLEKAYKLKENDYKLLVVGTSPERYAALK